VLARAGDAITAARLGGIGQRVSDWVGRNCGVESRCTVLGHVQRGGGPSPFDRWLAARLMPGERTQLLVELPPLRWPVLSNVVVKTLARVEWYLKEVVPLFLLGTALMFLLDKTGLLAGVIRVGEPLVTGWLGLPPEASAAFLIGFLRRDFGATGLFVMESQGLLNSLQVVVAMVTITLFIPCIASVMMIAKERSWGTALGMVALITPLAFVVGGLLNRALLLIGWGG